jgi:hypothetical protein
VNTTGFFARAAVYFCVLLPTTQPRPLAAMGSQSRVQVPLTATWCHKSPVPGQLLFACQQVKETKGPRDQGSTITYVAAGDLAAALAPAGRIPAALSAFFARVDKRLVLLNGTGATVCELGDTTRSAYTFLWHLTNMFRFVGVEGDGTKGARQYAVAGSNIMVPDLWPVGAQGRAAYLVFVPYADDEGRAGVRIVPWGDSNTYATVASVLRADALLREALGITRNWFAAAYVRIGTSVVADEGAVANSRPGYPVCLAAGSTRTRLVLANPLKASTEKRPARAMVPFALTTRHTPRVIFVAVKRPAREDSAGEGQYDESPYDGDGADEGSYDKSQYDKSQYDGDSAGEGSNSDGLEFGGAAAAAKSPGPSSPSPPPPAKGSSSANSGTGSSGGSDQVRMAQLTSTKALEKFQAAVAVARGAIAEKKAAQARLALDSIQREYAVVAAMFKKYITAAQSHPNSVGTIEVIKSEHDKVRYELQLAEKELERIVEAGRETMLAWATRTCEEVFDNIYTAYAAARDAAAPGISFEATRQAFQRQLGDVSLLHQLALLVCADTTRALIGTTPLDATSNTALKATAALAVMALVSGRTATAVAASDPASAVKMALEALTTLSERAHSVVIGASDETRRIGGLLDFAEACDDALETATAPDTMSPGDTLELAEDTMAELMNTSVNPARGAQYVAWTMHSLLGLTLPKHAPSSPENVASIHVPKLVVLNDITTSLSRAPDMSVKVFAALVALNAYNSASVLATPHVLVKALEYPRALAAEARDRATDQVTSDMLKTIKKWTNQVEKAKGEFKNVIGEIGRSQQLLLNQPMPDAVEVAVKWKLVSASVSV